MAKVKAANSSPLPKLRPALSPEARENQMIALAMDLVEQRLRDGTASSQETTHFLKAASQKTKLEMERLKLENDLTAAKTKATVSSSNGKEFIAYTVKSGDSLYSIAKKYPGVSTKDLQQANGLSGSDIRPGQVLKIPVG